MDDNELALVLAGPILRRIERKQVTIWFATSQAVSISLKLYPEQQSAIELTQTQLADSLCSIVAGEKLYYHLLDIKLPRTLPLETWIGYDLKLYLAQQTQALSWQDWAPDLVYPPRKLPGFKVPQQINRLFHGSCRKPHFASADGLVMADRYLAEHPHAQWPSLLMMSGDQIYADDVATPMLVAIHQLIEQLAIAEESFTAAQIQNSQQLHRQQAHYMARQQLLPVEQQQGGVAKALFGGVKKPIFTSDSAQNHLISLAEVLAMYLLVWSPSVWKNIDLTPPEALKPEQLAHYQQQREVITRFAADLTQVQRILAHLPSAMMFDDHDITDDWNLSAAWEQSAYSHAFSKRIIGNALCGYLLCQAWGNNPQQFSANMLNDLQAALQQPGCEAHLSLIDQLLSFADWHYQWKTQPPLIVLDTRTHRWRSERKLSAPSGLMDWQALTDLQQQLLGLDAVIMVSPAPIFGVKLIEAIQRLFTWLGKPLLVDAENWMAHPGSANALLNLFRHPNTPRHFVILSGDVHYSFAYRIELRGQNAGPDIWQITSSGIKNQFPSRLLDWLDRANRWLYSPVSPLNWFTKRRRMKIIPHRPEQAARGERLLNASGIGLVSLNADGSPSTVTQLVDKGRSIAFELEEQAAHWE
ncbi:alkaline phosphatase D family protein [Agarivorans sp. QJM3NY_25]|uniref:alkaline phosphatase D family protein n=1 Tax=Agarivorans sp. QJM3NY_25 TaxID=3421430 RepID=UPI003D7E5CC0